MNSNIKTVFFALAINCFLALAAHGQTTAFTYQGKLSDGANSAPSGAYDMRFRLYNTAIVGTGTQSGSDLIFSAATNNAITVSNGTFTVRLDFGSSPFAASADRYLEIAVKRAADADYTILADRQQITASPYSIRTVSAAAADSLSSACVGCVTNEQIGSVDAAKINGAVANATNADKLGGAAAANYLQTTGSGANLTDLNAGSISSGTLADARLSASVARRDAANAFVGDQTINGNLAQTGTTADLNLTNGFVARGAFGTGSVPASGAGVRMMFYPGKAAFRAGQVDGTQWDDANVGVNSFALGNDTTASGGGAFAFGDFARALGERSFAIGNGVQASGEGALALGTSAEATNVYSTALGFGCRSGGVGSTCIGFSSYAHGDRSISLGYYVTDCERYDCYRGTPGQTTYKVYKGVISFGDSSGGFTSDRMTATADNQFNVRAAGGIRFFTGRVTPPAGTPFPGFDYSTGVSVPAGGGAWQSMSDRNAKENFAPVNARDVLQKVLKLPITTWNYKSQAASVRHIGAMAQDFAAAFAVGDDDKHISTIDPDGVALAAIQGLNAELNERAAKLEAENKRLRAKLQTQDKQIADQRTQMIEFAARLKRLEETNKKTRRRVTRRK